MTLRAGVTDRALKAKLARLGNEAHAILRGNGMTDAQIDAVVRPAMRRKILKAVSEKTRQ